MARFISRNRIPIFVFAIFLIIPLLSYAQTLPVPTIDLQLRGARTPGETTLGLQVLFLLAILTLSPSIIIMTTSFIRVSIVLSFIQRALSLQDIPPRAIIMGVSLFLSFFIMQPTLTQINDRALQPYLSGRIGVNDFYGNIEQPMRVFMLGALNSKSGMQNLDLMLQLSKSEQGIRELTRSGNIEEMTAIPTSAIIPAFVLNELTIAFKMGIALFIPFIVIDLIVASALMSMGMIMLPPVMISLPIKLLLFVAVDGWKLLTMQIVNSFG